MAIAGPITSFAVALLAWGLGEGLVRWQVWPPVPAVIFYIGAINLILGIFNLVPGFPLDGGRVLRAVLWYFMGSLQRATRIAATVGAGFAFLLIGLGAVRFLGGNLIGGGWLALIGFFLWRASQSGYAQVLLRRMLEGVRVGEVMRSNVISLPPATTLQEAVERYFIRYGYHSFPVLSDGELIGMVSIEEIRKIPRSEWSSRTVEEVMDRGAVRSAVRASDPVLRAFRTMQEEGRGRLPVVDGTAELAGIISRRDIMNLFHLRLDLER
jgi:CBS domain-containing protein